MWMSYFVAFVAVAFTVRMFVRSSRAPKKVATEAPTLHQTSDEVSSYPKGEQHWTSDKTTIKTVYKSKKGVAASPSSTIGQLFKLASERHGDKLALRTERPCPPRDGKTIPPSLPLDQWASWTLADMHSEVTTAAKAFIALGLEPLQGVVIFGFNSPEWIMGQLAGIISGGITAGIYPSDTPPQVTYKASHSAAAIALVSDIAKAKTFVEGSKNGDLPDLRAVVVWDPEAKFDTYTDGDVKIVHWSDLATLAGGVSDEVLQTRIDAQKPGSVAAYIYTSGTTGNPKAVMITHDNIMFEATTIKELAFAPDQAGEERIISYLPLSHVAGMALDVMLPLAAAATTDSYFIVHFARDYDLKYGSFGDRLRTVQPTYFLGVPRVWEKIAEKMKAAGAKTKGLMKKIVMFAKGKGLAHAQNCQMGGSGKYPTFYGIAEKVVLSKVAAKLGLSQLKMGLTGAAPISVETLTFFGALGIQINEAYGMSECCGAATWSTNHEHVWGSCGFQLPGVEVKAFKPEGEGNVEVPPAKDLFHPTEEEQGELCYRGRMVMAGYMANKSLGQEHVDEINKKNIAAIDDEGWLHSGDKGCIDARGMVRITGRYKELIITAGGENVAPVPIEDAIKALCPAISNIMMLGDKKKFNVALVTLKAQGATGEFPGSDELDGDALKLNASVTTISGAMKDQVVIDTITAAITATNKNGDVCPSNASKIQKFSILTQDFSVSTGELTPTLKLKRAHTQGEHSDLVDKIYASKAVYVSSV